MRGLLSTGADYRTKALSGLTRDAGLESQRETENATLDAAKSQQRAKMGAEGAVLGGLAGYKLGGESLTGAGIGASMGFLFSRLF
jgi:hypothetical protein